MKKCELCDSLAKMYCESDQANLCWDCDSNVHGANFLVAKHSRALLCHICQSLTPWTATGPKLSPTVYVCQNCVNNSTCREERGNGDDHSSDGDDLDREDDENGDDSDEEEEEVEEENQVVPLSSTAPASSSSNSDQECSSMMRNSNEVASRSITTAFQLKLMREKKNAEQASQVSSTSRPLEDKKRTKRESNKGLQKPKIPNTPRSLKSAN